MDGPGQAATLVQGGARTLTVLGATGSVGQSTLALVREVRAREGRDAFPISSLTAQSRWRDLAALALEFHPKSVAIGDPRHALDLKDALAGAPIHVSAGAGAIIEAAQRDDADWVMAAIVGAAGLGPVMAAAERGALVALANKEALVCAGGAVMAAFAQSGGACLPVDSEHNAIFQVLNGPVTPDVTALILTASGGPFRTWEPAALKSVTPKQACAHPNWSMGAKISVDSATMMNKGLELIEARHLFNAAPEQLRVVVHPQSVVHSLVEYVDGSVLAQLGAADMRIPIAHALGWPDRLAFDAPKLDLAALGSLTFEAPDRERFACLGLAQDALARGDRATATLNGANEVAVAHFLDQRIGFLDISGVVAECLDFADKHAWLTSGPAGLDDIIALDRQVRSHAEHAAEEFGQRFGG